MVSVLENSGHSRERTIAVAAVRSGLYRAHSVSQPVTLNGHLAWRLNCIKRRSCRRFRQSLQFGGVHARTAGALQWTTGRHERDMQDGMHRRLNNVTVASSSSSSATAAAAAAASVTEISAFWLGGPYLFSLSRFVHFLAIVS